MCTWTETCVQPWEQYRCIYCNVGEITVTSSIGRGFLAQLATLLLWKILRLRNPNTNPNPITLTLASNPNLNSNPNANPNPNRFDTMQWLVWAWKQSLDNVSRTCLFPCLGTSWLGLHAAGNRQLLRRGTQNALATALPARVFPVPVVVIHCPLVPAGNWWACRSSLLA